MFMWKEFRATWTVRWYSRSYFRSDHLEKFSDIRGRQGLKEKLNYYSYVSTVSMNFSLPGMMTEAQGTAPLWNIPFRLTTITNWL